jgi:transcriptional regulator
MKAARVVLIMAEIVVDIRHQENKACCRRPTSMDSSRLDLLRGTLDLLILRALRSGPLHGWAVSERIQQISQDVLQVNQGSLYPALHRLEHHGWIKAGWGVSELGRRARFYSLTASGRKQLEIEAVNWSKLSGAIARVLRLA